jgi:hypothetical protein
MAHILYAVANATGMSAYLDSMEHSEDDCAIAALGVTHTGGGDNNWIFLPDCSDSRYWADHHITIKADNGAWVVSFWVNDDEGQTLYWSDFNGYSTEHPVPESKDVTDCALMIILENGAPKVIWRPW